MKDKSLVFKFTSEKFDYKGEIPEDSNAGNKFYGRDVAAYLSEKLSASNNEISFLDEDWGWLVLGKIPPTHSFDICIYNVDTSEDPNEQKGSNTWNLLVSMFEKVRFLGLIPIKKEIAIEPWLQEKLKSVLSDNGIKLLSIDKDL